MIRKTPMVYNCCGREVCDAATCPNNGPWGQTSKWRMDAYYYGFEPTGVAAVDKILSAAACAGKCFHSTEDWIKTAEGFYEYHSGACPVDWIQNAANEAAAVMTATKGFKLMPIDPTPEMYEAFEKAIGIWLYEIGDASDVYKALIESAPEYKP